MSEQPTTSITGIDDLVALPVGARFQDRDGDVFVKTDQDTYTSYHYTFPATYMAEYLPALVVAEPTRYSVGDEVRIISPEFLGARVVPGDIGTVVRIEDAGHLQVRFPDNLHLPLKPDEVELVRRDIESARAASDEAIDRIVGAFRKLLDRAPTATKDPNQELPPAEDVLITSLDELRELPDGSVVAATIPTAVPVRYKDGDSWRATSEGGTFNYTTARLARAGKLRLVFRPAA